MPAGRLVIPNYMPAEDSNGSRYGFAKMWTYENGTTTLKTTYSNSALTTPNANPVVADSAGQFPAIWSEASEPVQASELFSVAVWTADGEQLAAYSNVSPTLDADTAAAILAESAAISAGVSATAAAASAAEAEDSATAAAESATEAEAAATLVLNDIIGGAETVAAASAVEWPATLDFVRTAYYSTVGDFGGALYKRVSSPTTTVGYWQDATGAYFEYAEETVRAAAFGCKDSLSDDQYAAIQGAIDFMLACPWTREVQLPPGSFRINSPIIVESPTGATSVRNVKITGTGGYNGTTGTLPGSRIYYYGATTLDVNGGFQVISGYFITIEDICFRAQVAGLDCMVQIYAADSPSFSGVSTAFNRCHFTPGTGINFRKGEVWIVDTRNTTFSDCTFTIGATVQRPAYVAWLGNTGDSGDPDYRATLQGGQVIGTVFYNCYIQGDVATENVGQGMFLGCTFGDMGNDNLGNSRGAAIVPVGFERVGNLTIDSCIFGDEDATVSAIKQSSYAPATQTSEDTSGLIVRNTMIRDRTVGLEIVRGWVELSSNKWYPRNPGTTAVQINSTTVGPVTGLRSQDWSQIMRDNDNPVPILDNRASIKSAQGPVIANDSLAASPTAFTALATDTDIISVASVNLPGQRIRWSWSATAYNPGVDAAEVKVWGSIATTVTTPIQRVIIPAGGYYTFSLGGWTTAAAYAKATTLRLRGRQESGASYVQFLNNSNGNTTLQVELWDG